MKRLIIFVAFATLALIPTVAAHQTAPDNPIGPLTAIDANPRIVMMPMGNGFHGGHHSMLVLNEGKILIMFTINTDDTTTHDHEVLILAGSFESDNGPRGAFTDGHFPFMGMGEGMDGWVHANIGAEVHWDSEYFEMAHEVGT